MPHTRAFLVWTAGILALLLVLGVALGTWTVRRSFPQTAGTVDVEGLSGTVEVLRDAQGIPQIYADNAEDLFRAQGFVHAQERFYEMDFRRHVTAGRLAELVGESGLDADVFTRSLGWYDVAAQEVAMLDTETRRYLQAYAAGVNAYIEGRDASELSLEYAVLGLTGPTYVPEAWTATDSVAWLKALAWDLSSNMTDEIDRALASTRVGNDRVEQLYPDYPTARHPPVLTSGAVVGGWFRPGRQPVTARARPPLPRRVTTAVAERLRAVRAASDQVPRLLGHGEGVGSNSWVLSAERSATGAPLLANDTHETPSMPGTWMQLGLHCRTINPECRFDVSGFTFSGLPGVVVGHNDRIAWGLTNMYADVADLYVEQIRGGTYLYDGRRAELQQRQERFLVAGQDRPVVKTVRATTRGPLLSDVDGAARQVAEQAPVSRSPSDGGEYAVSLQWTALAPGRTMDSLLSINEARSFEEFRAAARSFSVPSQNLVYADVDGHIGYQATGDIPIRRTGDGRWPAPGWDPQYGWRDTIDFAQLPWTRDPRKGMVVTANQAVVDPATYPFELGADMAQGYRSRRLAALLGRQPTWTVDELADLQLDTRHPMIGALRSRLLKVSLETDYAREGQQLLVGWDGSQPADSAAAAYFNVVWRKLLVATFHDELPEEVWPSGGERWYSVVSQLLRQPRSRWWDDVTTKRRRETRDDILELAMIRARQQLTSLIARDVDRWSWGAVHELELVNPTLGASGAGAVEALFNRGPYETPGGPGAIAALSWDAAQGYDVTVAPSMRMVVPMDDLDDARWVTYGGVSGHAFAEHYNDQTETYVAGQTLAWPFSRAAVDSATEQRLLLTPASGPSTGSAAD